MVAQSIRGCEDEFSFYSIGNFASHKDRILVALEASMLVLSRRADQQIVFPNLGITLQVLQLKGKIVKIGISAPKTISVVRPENSGCGQSSESPTFDASALDHRLRNELNLLQLRLEVLRRRLDQGEEVDLDATVAELLGGVDAIDYEMAPEPQKNVLSNRRSLFMVEDSDNERKLMAYTLAGHGFDVQVARDGTEAIEILGSANRLPDFVLLDLEMPVSNGLEVLSFIRHDARLQHLNVFAVTGSERRPELEPLGRSWDGWFQKPLDMGRLISRLTQADVESSSPVVAE